MAYLGCAVGIYPKVSGYTSIQSYCAIFLNRGQLLREEFTFRNSSSNNTFPLSELPFGRSFRLGREHKNHKSCFPSKKWWRPWRCAHKPLDRFYPDTYSYMLGVVKFQMSDLHSAIQNDY